MQIKSEYDGKEIVIDIPDSEYWLDRAKKRVSAYWSNADNVEKELNKKFLETYKSLEKEFLAFSNKYGKDGVLTYSQKRVVSLMLELKPHIDRLYLDEDKLVTDHLSESYSDNYVKGMYELTSGTSVAFNFAKIDNRAVQAAITYPWSGASFSDRIYQNKDKLINVLRQEITSSLIRGDSTQQTARVISDRLDISRKDANMLVQTETAAVITSSDKKAYTDFGIQEYEYEATLDNRTSPICRELDMQVFDVQDMTSGLNAPPMHPRCYKDDVEVFTDQGWKLFADLNGDEMFWSFNKDNAEGENGFIKARKFIAYELNGEENLLRFYNREIDITVTKDHSMLIMNKNKKMMLVPSYVFESIIKTGDNKILYPSKEKINIEEVEYVNRNVYCVELEKWNTLYVRTKGVYGKELWCGNCRSTTVPHFDYTFSKRISKSLKTGSVEYVPQISYKEWEKRFVE